MPPAKAKSAARVPLYQIKVTLEHVKPAVWRRLLVPANLSLAKLHRVLQIAMGPRRSRIRMICA